MPNGIVSGALGYIADQTELLQIAVDGLAVYNQTVDPMLDDFTEDVVKQELRVSQYTIQFNRHADGGTPEAQKQGFRLINVPLKDYDAGTPFTVIGLQDALPSDITSTLQGVIAGDVERTEMEFFRRIFTPHASAGSISTAQEYGFYNGELDVPNYKNNTFFGTAHYHYLGLNTTTLALSHFQGMRKDIQEHGYGIGPGALVCFLNSAQSDALENLLNINVASSLTTSERQKAQDQGAYGTGLVYDGIEFVINDNVPAGYLAMIDRTVKPIARRLHLNPELRGLQMFAQSFNEQYPLAGQMFLNRYGFGVRHLGAGTVRQLVGSNNYTAPTFRLAA